MIFIVLVVMYASGPKAELAVDIYRAEKPEYAMKFCEGVRDSLRAHPEKIKSAECVEVKGVWNIPVIE